MQINKKKIYEQLKINPRNVRFKAICEAAELFGFRLRGVREVTEYTSEMA